MKLSTIWLWKQHLILWHKYSEKLWSILKLSSFKPEGKIRIDLQTIRVTFVVPIVVFQWEFWKLNGFFTNNPEQAACGCFLPHFTHISALSKDSIPEQEFLISFLTMQPYMNNTKLLVLCCIVYFGIKNKSNDSKGLKLFSFSENNWWFISQSLVNNLCDNDHLKVKQYLSVVRHSIFLCTRMH